MAMGSRYTLNLSRGEVELLSKERLRFEMEKWWRARVTRCWALNGSEISRREVTKWIMKGSRGPENNVKMSAGEKTTKKRTSLLGKQAQDGMGEG